MEIDIIDEIKKLVEENTKLKETVTSLNLSLRNLSMREGLYQSELANLKNDLRKISDKITTSPHSNDIEYSKIVYGDNDNDR